jgi:drug/metabolite transporter (DMT)-like permease
MSENLPTFLGPMAAFGSSVTWAWATIGYSQLAKHNSAFAVSFVRSLVGLPLFLLATLIFSGLNDFANVSSGHIGWFALSSFASYGFADALFLFSTRSLGVPGALAITATYPLFTALFGYFFRSETLNAMQVFGLLITIAGVIVVVSTTPVKEAKSQKKEILTGVALALATSILWAINGFAVANGTVGISIFVANVLRLVCGLIVVAICGKIILPRKSMLISKSDLSFGLKYFSVEAFFGSLFFTYGLSHSSLAIGSTLSSLAPVVSVPMAWIFKTEKVTPVRTAGICSVVVGLTLLVGTK